MKRTTRAFKRISKDAYVDLFLKSNPSDCRRDVVERLDFAIASHRDGIRCDCGEEIWIIGSAEAGLGCFTCITGDSEPSDDYEIDVLRPT